MRKHHSRLDEKLRECDLCGSDLFFIWDSGKDIVVSCDKCGADQLKLKGANDGTN